VQGDAARKTLRKVDTVIRRGKVGLDGQAHEKTGAEERTPKEEKNGFPFGEPRGCGTREKDHHHCTRGPFFRKMSREKKRGKTPSCL